MRSKRKIKRDYNKPFFSNRSSGRGWLLFAFGLLIGGIIGFTYWQFDNMQLAALDIIGIAPTATPFASDYANKGAQLYVDGDVLGAEREFAHAVQLQPNNVTYLYEYGKILIELERPEEAVPYADRAIQVAPDDVRGYALKARALMWDDPTVAIPTAVTGMEIDPNYAPLHGALAIAYTNIGRYGQGLERGIEAIRLDPLDPFVHRAYSIPLIYTGRNSQAIEQLEEAIAINPNLTAPYFELAAQYNVIDFPEMAVGIYRRILTIDPNSAKAYLRICETYAGQGEFREAEGFCDIALEINPNYAQAHRMLGQVQYTRRNYEGAIASFETCVDLGSVEVECYYLRGLAHYILDECDDAWVVLQESLQYAEQELIIENINLGLGNIKTNCVGYSDVQLPTPIPPTPIPPTPIGGI